MVMRSHSSRSQLFTLRIWPEETPGGGTEWRGKLERVVDGDTIYFRDLGAMLALLRQKLESLDGQSLDTSETEAHERKQEEKEA